MPEDKEISMPSTEETVEAATRAIQDRYNSMMYLETVKRIEDGIRKHYERLAQLQDIVRAAKALVDLASECSEGFATVCCVDIKLMNELKEKLDALSTA